MAPDNGRRIVSTVSAFYIKVFNYVSSYRHVFRIYLFLHNAYPHPLWPSPGLSYPRAFHDCHHTLRNQKARQRKTQQRCSTHCGSAGRLTDSFVQNGNLIRCTHSSIMLQCSLVQSSAVQCSDGRRRQERAGQGKAGYAAGVPSGGTRRSVDHLAPPHLTVLTEERSPYRNLNTTSDVVHYRRCTSHNNNTQGPLHHCRRDHAAAAVVRRGRLVTEKEGSSFT